MGFGDNRDSSIRDWNSKSYSLYILSIVDNRDDFTNDIRYLLYLMPSRTYSCDIWNVSKLSGKGGYLVVPLYCWSSVNASAPSRLTVAAIVSFRGLIMHLNGCGRQFSPLV